MASCQRLSLGARRPGTEIKCGRDARAPRTIVGVRVGDLNKAIVRYNGIANQSNSLTLLAKATRAILKSHESTFELE